ncbi:MAG: class I SAM-dependent methyltransferase [Longimicrobiales bacterium]|nr:class I SAM-dependent methyltransferase [Longimicrobiales bacterium]
MEYRCSHLTKGDTYDQDIESDPFDAYMAAWQARYLSEVIPELFPGVPPRYLDFACGTGRITEVVAPMASSVTGVDVSRSMLTVAESKLPSATFLEADLTRGPAELGPFDLVTAFRFFGNADPELRTAALTALNRLQPTGGILVLNNHRNPRSVTNLLDRLRGEGALMDLTHPALRRLLDHHGYEVVAARPIGAWQVLTRLMLSAGRHPEREARLERIFDGALLCHIAPDSVLVARKVAEARKVPAGGA